MEKEWLYHSICSEHKTYQCIVGEEAVTHFSDSLKEFDVYKGGIRFKFNQEMPFSLISDIARWCFTMDQTR